MVELGIGRAVSEPKEQPSDSDRRDICLFRRPARADPFDKSEIMRNAPKRTTPKPPTARQRAADNDVLRLLADQRGRTVSSIAHHFAVAEPSIRIRLLRLIEAQAVSRTPDDMTPRGRRTRYLYRITSQGLEALAKAAEEVSALQKPKPRLIWG